MATDDETPAAPSPGETATGVLHRLTSYVPGREWTDPADDERVVRGYEVNDPAHRPMPYKAYDDDLTHILLPDELPGSLAPATEVLAGTAHVEPAALDLAQLARVLHLTAGVTRTTERDGVRQLFRAAGSAGARFPLELYVAVPSGLWLPPGVHWYDPEGHALVTVGPPPHGTAPALVVTGVPWRSAWRYRERAFRHLFWDAGTALAHVLALADSAGLDARLFTAFADDEVSALVGADGVREFPLAVVALGAGDPALHPTGDTMAGHHDADGLVLPLVTAARDAGRRTALGPEVGRGAPVAASALGDGAPVEDVIARKGSARRMRADARVPRALLVDAMAAALRGVDVEHLVGVSGVDDVATGIHAWPDLDAPVRPLGEEETREALHGAGLEQGLCHDAAFVAMAVADLDRVDDHRYRELQLLAGLAEGRLHLMAWALGVGASGMTFRDADLPALYGRDLDGLLWTCVGVPEYRTRRSGAPGAPSEVRVVWPR